MEFCQLDIFLDDFCENAGSPMEYMNFIYDNSVIWNVSQQTTLHLLQDNVKECGPNDPIYRSPACATPNINESDLSYNFITPIAVKCLRVAKKQPRGGTEQGPPMPMKVYGCPSDTVVRNGSGFFDANGAVWDRETYCLRFDDAILQGYDRPQPVRLRSDCLFPISLEAAQLAQAAGEDFRNSPRLSCFCTQQANLDTFLRIPGYRKTPAGQICEEWAWYQGTQMGIRAGGVLAVMIINNILLLVFAYLDSLGRYQTATDLASSQVFNLFFATLVNTAIVYNLIGMNFYTSSNNVFGALRFGQGPFDDLTPLWFLTIGNMLVITIVCQAACSVVLPVLWIWTVDPALRWFFARDTHSQELLNEYHIFPEWTLSLRVAETLVIVFCVFMYSSGFPILYLCGSLYCFLAYWGDKYTLLRGSRRPPGYTKSAIESAVVMMPFAIVFHAVFGLWLYGNQELFPSDWGGLKGLVEGIIGIGYAYYNEIMEVVAKGGFDVRGGNYNQYLQARMVDSARAAAEPLLWLFFAQLFYYALVILHWIFRPCIGNTVGDAMEWTLKALKIWKDAEVTKISLSEAKERDDQKGLLSYRMDANPNYEEAMVALKFDPDAETPHHKKVDKKQSGVSFSKFEEQLERTVATKMHNAENFVAGALDRIRVFGKSATRMQQEELQVPAQGRVVI